MVFKKSSTLTIETPEGIVFSLQLAGPVTRFLAWCVDMACIGAISGIINTTLGILGVISRDVAVAATVLAYFIVSVGYSIATEWHWQGQTIGKRLLQLRVADAQGLRLQFSQIVIRNLLRFVDSLPIFYMVGGIACLISGKVQRLGDLAGNTVVIWAHHFSQPDLSQVVNAADNSMADWINHCARLRRSTSPGEANMALQALLRRDDFAPDARVALFRDIADHFKSEVEFPPEATEGVSNEQYVRNVVDILFRKSPAAGG
jgi:uncharacterized RDD family membrane protein YckC